jgi:hypothetical protein
VHWPAKAFWSDSRSNDIQCLWRSQSAHWRSASELC